MDGRQPPTSYLLRHVSTPDQPRWSSDLDLFWAGLGPAEDNNRPKSQNHAVQYSSRLSNAPPRELPGAQPRHSQSDSAYDSRLTSKHRYGLPIEHWKGCATQTVCPMPSEPADCPVRSAGRSAATRGRAACAGTRRTRSRHQERSKG